MHDPTKILLGTTPSSVIEATPEKGSIEAGLAVRQKSDGALSIAKADGSLIGISLGKDLSDAGFISVLRMGLKVPVLLTDGFDPEVGKQVHIHDTTGRAGAAGASHTGVDATYASGRLTGVKEDGTTTGVALIDMEGGL